MLRYPESGAAVLFPPYALLTAALVFSERRHWIWYVLIGAVAHFATNWPQWSLTWVAGRRSGEHVAGTDRRDTPALDLRRPAAT